MPPVRLLPRRTRLLAAARVVGVSLVAATLVAGCASTSGDAAGTPPSGSGPGPTGLRGTQVISIVCKSTVFQPDDTAAVLPSVPVRMVICPLPMPDAASTKADLRPPPQDLVRALALADGPKPTGTPYACAAYADVPRLVYAQTADGTLYLLHIPVDACGHYLGDALTTVNRYAQDGPVSQ